MRRKGRRRFEETLLFENPTEQKLWQSRIPLERFEKRGLDSSTDATLEYGSETLSFYHLLYLSFIKDCIVQSLTEQRDPGVPYSSNTITLEFLASKRKVC